jgi:uncharacterized protein YeaO (DUF488 family)
MLRQASVSDLITGRASREKGYVVIAMRRYPRFINRQLRDEYLPSLAADKELFEDWLSVKRRYQNHEGAYGKVKFEKRFDLTTEGLEHLARLSALASHQEVYLVCQCHEGHRCHREMLLILARRLFKAKAEKPKNAYLDLEKRIPEIRKKWKASAA